MPFSDLIDLTRLTRFWGFINTKLNGKYDKTGGDINGNVKVFGTITQDIEDEDYDAGIRAAASLDDNLGTILTLTGYANGQEATTYRPVIRSIHDPVNNYDVANKKYVDDHVGLPNYHLVFLNSDGTIDTFASTLQYNTVVSNLSNTMKADYLDVFWGDTRFYAKAIETINVNNGDIKFIGEIEYQGIQRYIVFTLTPSNTLTTTNIITFEGIHNKVQNISQNSTSTDKYPSAAAVFNEFQRKPVVIWEAAAGSSGLKALQTDIAATINWQLTGLDMTPYKRIKIYSKGGQGQTNAGTTGAMVLEMSLDSRMAIATKGGHYVGSVLSQKPNDANRYASLTCAVSADKTSFAVLRQSSLYGTAVTTNNDIGADVVLIEGYYD